MRAVLVAVMAALALAADELRDSRINIAGEPGPPGPPGQQGGKGDVGPMGPTGERGFDGPRGVQGERGPVGPTGRHGPQGFPGVTGPTGATGDAGRPGPFSPISTASPLLEFCANAETTKRNTFNLNDASSDDARRYASGCVSETCMSGGQYVPSDECMQPLEPHRCIPFSSFVSFGMGLEGFGTQRRSELVIGHCERDWESNGKSFYACPDTGCGGTCHFAEAVGYGFNLPDGFLRSDQTLEGFPRGGLSYFGSNYEVQNHNWGQRFSQEAAIETSYRTDMAVSTGGVMWVGWEYVKESQRRQSWCGSARDSVLVLDPIIDCQPDTPIGQICQTWQGLRSPVLLSSQTPAPTPMPPTPVPP